MGPLPGRGVRETVGDRAGSGKGGVGSLGAARRHRQPDQHVVLLLDRDAHRAVGEDAGELLRLHPPEVQLRDLHLRLRVLGQLHQPVEEAPELERGEQAADLLDVPLPHHRVLGREVEIDVRDDPCEVLVQGEPLTGRLDVLLQLPLQLLGSAEELLDGAELLDELRRRLVPHARDAGDVVGRIPFERHVLEVLRRRDAVSLLDGRLIHEGDVGDPSTVEQDPEPGTDELEEVAVGRDDRRLDPLLGRPDGERADRVVGLVIGHQEHPDPEGLHDLLDQPQLGSEVLRRLPASRLVLRVHRQSGGRLAHVEGHGDQVGSLLREELDEHRGEPVDGVRDLARGGGEGARQGEEGPVRERMAVEDEESARLVRRIGGGRHGVMLTGLSDAPDGAWTSTRGGRLAR